MYTFLFKATFNCTQGVLNWRKHHSISHDWQFPHVKRDFSTRFTNRRASTKRWSCF